jgi:putative ABC transport system permease protein
MLFESIKMSWSNIVHNKLRSFLTMLGIVIGVASIIALITIVQGATNSISDQVNALGVNKVTVNAMGTPLKQGLTQTDLDSIAKLDNIQGISPTISGKTGVEAAGKLIEDVKVQGKNEVYFQNDTTLLNSGRAINILDVDGKNRVAVIGSDVVQELFYGINPVGKDLTINGITYTVIGTLTSSDSFGMNSNNDLIIIPYTTALRNLGVKNVTNLDVYLKDPNLADDTVVQIQGVLNQAFNYKEDAYNVFNMGEMIDTF